MILFESLIKCFGYNISSAEKKLKYVQSLNSSDFIDWQEKKKWEIAIYHYNNNKEYRKKVGNTFPDKWEDLPIMEKSDFQVELDSILSNGYNQNNIYISNTSGSSGHPFFFAKNKESHAMSWALIKNRYSWHGLNINSKQARFFGIPLEKSSSRYKEKFKDYIMNRVRFPIFDMSDKVLWTFLKKFEETKFDYLYGYTNSLVLFARYLIDNNIILKEKSPDIKMCIPTSETVTEEDREIMQAGFGVNVINEYGISEVGGIVAFEDTNLNWRLSSEIQYHEIDDSTDIGIDNSGDIIITDLYNKAMPFIRYRAGDIASFHTSKFDNNNYPILKNLLGRTNDTIILPNGTVSPGLTFYYVSRSILESSGILKEFIIRQIALDTFVFDVIAKRELNENEINEIKDKMDIYLQPGLKLIINILKNISRPKSASGKIKHFYSEIDSG